MKSKFPRIIIILILSAVFMLPCQGLAYADSIAVIVNKKTPFDDITLTDLEGIFKKEIKKLDDGSMLIPINREYGTDIRNSFVEMVFKKSPDEMKRFWLEKKYKGVTPPSVQKSVLAVKRMVNNVPGAISYILESEVDDSVKVLKIEGLMPRENGYVLTIKNKE